MTRGPFQYCLVPTDWGTYGFVALHGRLLATYLPQHRIQMKSIVLKEWPDAKENRSLLPSFQRSVIDYYRGRPTRLQVPVDTSWARPFARSVLEACRRVPYGSRATYSELASAVARPRAARAVGTVMARNPLPLVVPCHRIVRSDGSLGGFSCPQGIEVKLRMLEWEGNASSRCDSESRGRSRGTSSHTGRFEDRVRQLVG